MRPPKFDPSPLFRIWLAAAVVMFALLALTGCGEVQSCKSSQQRLQAIEVCAKVRGCNFTPDDMSRAIRASEYIEEYCK